MKSFKYSDIKGLKVGDEVFLGDMDELKVDYCLMCKPPPDEFIEKNMEKLIFDNTCEKHLKSYPMFGHN